MGDILRKQVRNIYTEGRRKDRINRGGEMIVARLEAEGAQVSGA